MDSIPVLLWDRLAEVLIAVIGVVGVIAHKTGNLHIGKKNGCPPEVQKVCKEHRDVILNMTNITTDIAGISVCVQGIKRTIEETKDKINAIHDKVDSMSERLSQHEGFHKGADK